MIAISNNAKFFLFKEATSMHKSFEGLSALVDEAFPDELMKGYFIFLNRRKDRMKVLYWDGDGFAIWYKRLEKGSFLRQKNSSPTLDRRAFLMLLEGVTPEKIQSRFSWE
jgi:transposase